MSKNKKNTFEEAINRLEEISGLLDSNDLGLEESISLYEEGIELSKFCFEKLQQAELKVSVLKQNLENKLEESEFEE
jgi:exodeoxyribonuclease VII small subunit